jgi:hypothetical protein
VRRVPQLRATYTITVGLLTVFAQSQFVFDGGQVLIELRALASVAIKHLVFGFV